MISSVAVTGYEANHSHGDAFVPSFCWRRVYDAYYLFVTYGYAAPSMRALDHVDGFTYYLSVLPFFAVYGYVEASCEGFTILGSLSVVCVYP